QPFVPAAPMNVVRTTEPAERLTGLTPATPAMPPSPSSAAEGRKAQAQILLAQARQFQKDGRLIEARQKALEAQQAGASFGPDEDRPEQCLLAVSALCQRRIESHLQQASEYLATAELDPSRYQRAEAELMQAKQLASAFRLDTQIIDNKLTMVQQARSKSWTTVPGNGKSQISQAIHQDQALAGGDLTQQQ